MIKKLAYDVAGFLARNTLKIADFCRRTLCQLDEEPFAAERSAKAKVDYPEFIAYGERFSKEMAYESRDVRPV